MRAGRAADGLSLVGPPPAAAPAEGAHAEAFGVAEKALTTALQTEVQNIANQARGQMRTNPEHAIEMLRLEMEKIKATPGTDAGCPRAVDEHVAGGVAGRETKEDRGRASSPGERGAAGAGHGAAVGGPRTDAEQQNVKQLIDRVDFLLEEARFAEGDEAQKKSDDAMRRPHRGRARSMPRDLDSGGGPPPGGESAATSAK